MSATLSPEKFIQMGMGFWAAKALMSAVELQVPTHLAKGPKTADELCKSIGMQGRGSKDFFDCLVALGVIERKGDVYHNTPEADRFLDKNKPTYMGGIIEMSSQRLWEPWGRLTEALRTGQPQNGQSGDPNHFDHIYSDERMVKLFAEAMTGISTRTAQVIAEKFPWGDYKSFCDVGCAQGALPVQLALAHKHLSGIGSDLPVVKRVFEEYVRRFNLESRLRFEACDLFKDQLPRAEVYVFGHMLHAWSLNEKCAMVKKAYDALPKSGALIVFDAMIDDDRRKNAFGLLMSLNMLLETPTGFDYTGGECIGWLKDAGFRDVSITPLNGPDSMVVGLK